MKKAVVFLLAVMLLFTACGTENSGYSSDKELYEFGHKIVLLMEEMIESDEYAQLMSANVDYVVEVREMVGTVDYSSPKAVYRIVVPKIERLTDLLLGSDKTLWNNLSDNLKKQVENKVTASVISSIIVATEKGYEYVAFSSMYTASDMNESIKLEEPTVFMYVFEDDVSILVSFTRYGGANGRFAFYEGVDTLEGAKAIFEKYECSVSKVDIK